MHVIKILTVLKIDNKNRADPTAIRGEGSANSPEGQVQTTV